MKYGYDIVKGIEITFEDLKLARAKDIALAVQQHPYCLADSISYVTRESGEEIILVTFDNEISEEPLNGIEVYEDVAIICYKKDKHFPEVYALRENFKGGLSHTNLCAFEHPISLCVTEENFEEAKHKFNEYEFIESIRRWFALSAEDSLHQESQPLEAFFHSKGYAILPLNLRPGEPCFLERIGSSRLYRVNNNSNSNTSFLLLHFVADPTLHGFIRKEPRKLSDLDETITVSGNPFSNVVCNMLNSELNDFAENKNSWGFNLGFLAQVPVLRNNDEEPSKTEFLLFVAKESILELGSKSGCIDKIDGKWGRLLFKKFDEEIIKNTAIDLFSTMDDFSTIAASIYNNIEFNDSRYCLIGAGALGSQVLSLFSRIGFGKWFLLDHDMLLPHNIAKHALSRNDIGGNKAVKLAHQVNELVGSEMVEPIDKKLQDFELDAKFAETICKSEMILDISTSIAVARKLARDYNQITDKPRVSSFLNPVGTDLVILAEDKNRHHRLDCLEMQYYRSLVETAELNLHLAITINDKVRYNRNSCREITNKINQTDVAIHASVCAKTIQKISRTGESCISVWNIDNETNEVKRYNFEPTNWTEVSVSNWNICIDEFLISKMQNYRQAKLPNETGGILIGAIDNERKVIYLIDTILAPKDSIEEGTSYIRGTDGLIDKYKRYIDITDNQVLYLGEWHSHPKNCSTNPSNLDEELFCFLATTLGQHGYPAVMCIVGDTDINLEISLNYERID